MNRSGTRELGLAVALVAALVLLTGCGGGSSTTNTDNPRDLTLADDITVLPGTYRLPPAQLTALRDVVGDTINVPADGLEVSDLGLTLRCTTPPCIIRINDDTIRLMGTLGVAMTPEDTDPDPDSGSGTTSGTPSSGGGGGGGTVGTLPPGNVNGGGGDTSDSSALKGVLWDHDEDPANPNIEYVFESTYVIPGVDEDGRTERINKVNQDGRYAGLTSNDIRTMIAEIREGLDHTWATLTEDELREQFQRVLGQYGHTPDATQGASLEAFIEAGEQGVAVLVGAQGVSQGIADAAWADRTAIKSLIAAFQQYIDKAKEAKDALEVEARRLGDRQRGVIHERDEFATDARDEVTRLRGELSALPPPDLNGVLLQLREDEVAKLDMEIAELNTEIAALDGEINDLTAEITTLNTWIMNVDLFNIPDGCSDLESCTTLGFTKAGELTTKQNMLTTKQGMLTTKQGERTTKQAEIDRSEELQEAIDDKQKEVNAKNAEAEAAEQKVIDLENEADRLRIIDVPAIETEIDSITDNQKAARWVLEGNPDDPKTPGDEKELRLILSNVDPTRARLENQKAEKVREYLEDQFKANVMSHATLLGTGANFITLVEREQGDPDSVFARPDRPANTMDAWQALGNVISRTIVSPPQPNNKDQPLFSDLKELQDKFADGSDSLNLESTRHRAKVLDAKPAAADFVLTDAQQQSTYDATPTRGQHYEGIYKGIHGTLYFDEVSTDSNQWLFTPTRNGVDNERRRGRDPELFRYEDADSDGIYKVVGFVDYGMWLSDTGGSLTLSLLAGVVGPQSGTDDLGTVVDVTTGSRTNSASYRGTAQGLSARQTDGTTASGHFEADVKLDATFGSAATLTGTIDNFRSANPAEQGTAHVSSEWSMGLDSETLAQRTNPDIDSDSMTPFAGVVNGDFTAGLAGNWSGVGYGEPGERPVGFYGGFRAEFSDGVAAGVYHAEAE